MELGHNNQNFGIHSYIWRCNAGALTSQLLESIFTNNDEFESTKLTYIKKISKKIEKILMNKKYKCFHMLDLYC